jgi:hypothetical protein
MSVSDSLVSINLNSYVKEQSKADNILELEEENLNTTREHTTKRIKRQQTKNYSKLMQFSRQLTKQKTLYKKQNFRPCETISPSK